MKVSEQAKIKIRKIRLYKYLLKNKIKRFLSKTEEVLLREMKEDDIRIFWGYLGRLKIERNYEEEAKIFLCVILMFILATFIGGGNFLFADHFRIFYKMSNAQAKEDPDFKITESANLDTNIEKINKYKLKSSEEICGETKNKKQSSGLCGKDDEEELKKIAEEEKRKKIQHAIASRPKIVRISCNEKNYGHPSKSDTKGKHMDEDCCPDPDEWPKPGCAYDAKGYSIMISKPKK